ncbi:MAG: SAM-dependent methyltransferase [Rhodospirillales bacterium]|nr:SAM-dependent methyltransferase [Rhodospirillales bacterium]
MLTLTDHLRDRITEHGPLSVAQYMSAALTHPRFGYYMGGDPFGLGGDFITAPEISQMFGELIGLWCIVEWQAMGSPEPLNLVELGPGRGALMADLLRAGRGGDGFLEALNVSLIEVSPVLKEAQEDALVKKKEIHAARTLHWLSDISEVSDGPMVLVANEFIDALPVHQFQMTPRGWRERLVGLKDDEGRAGFSFTLATDAPADDIIPPGIGAAQEGDILEARPGADDLACAIAGRLLAYPGAALIIDYGHGESAVGETLQAVREHEYQDPLLNPGAADLTAHVDFGAFARAAAEAGAEVHGPVSQGAFLKGLGIDVRAEALMAASPAHVQDIEEAHKRLTSDDAMGQLFKVMALTSPGMAPPPGFE